MLIKIKWINKSERKNIHRRRTRSRRQPSLRASPRCLPILRLALNFVRLHWRVKRLLMAVINRDYKLTNFNAEDAQKWNKAHDVREFIFDEKRWRTRMWVYIIHKCVRGRVLVRRLPRTPLVSVFRNASSFASSWLYFALSESDRRSPWNLNAGVSFRVFR